MCKWLQIAAETLQSQNRFMIKVYKTWDGNCIWPFDPKTPFTPMLTPKFGQKWTVLGATLAQITYGHNCRLLQKHSKVKFGSQTRIIKPGMGIIHGILSQPQHFLPIWPPVLVKNKQLQGWFGPNHMCAWLKTDAEPQPQHPDPQF